MAEWEDVEFTSPHNLGACRMLVGDLDAQGDGRNPPSKPVGNGGTEGGGEVEAGQGWCP